MESSQDPHLSSANAAAAQQLDHQLPEEKGQQEDSKDVGDRPPFQQKVDLERQSEPSSREATTDDMGVTRNDPIRVRFVRHLQAEIDTNKVTLPMLGFCLMTGWTDAVSFAAAFIFSGFQTGNVVQLAAALARLFSGPDRSTTFHQADRLATASICSFLFGAFLGQIGDRIGPKKRLWVCGATMLQAGFMMGACVCVLVAHEPSYATDRGFVSWTDALGYVTICFTSASMGLQGIVAKRLNSHYGTTVVLTTIWCELVADPGLFKFKKVPSRDHRFGAVFMLLLGAFVGRILVGTIGGGATLGIGAAIKAIIALVFWFTPSKPVKVVKE